ncbi:MAG: hypothetical protein ABR875_01540 [Minisyncoccia bacterium]
MKKKIEVGDYIRTTQIAPNSGETDTEAQVRKIEGTSAEVIYGGYSDRSWVSLDSCRFVRKGVLSGTDLIDPNPCNF